MFSKIKTYIYPSSSPKRLRKHRVTKFSKNWGSFLLNDILISEYKSCNPLVFRFFKYYIYVHRRISLQLNALHLRKRKCLQTRLRENKID